MYKFDPAGEPVEAAFRAIALSQLDEALSDLAEGDSEGRSLVHEARRRCKKLRGLLRLVRPAFPDFATENAAVRDAAALLSHLRDAEVLRHTVSDLARWRNSVVLERMAARLTSAGPPRNDQSEKISEFRDRLQAVRGRAEHWSLTRSGPNALLPGLRATYRSGRRRTDKAERNQEPVDFHEWRKAGKNYGFHLDLLRKLAPDLLADDLKTVEQLATLLGEHHDLSVLHQTSGQSPDRFGNAGEVAELRDALEARRDQVEAEALHLGRQIFAERPRAVTARFRHYWNTVS